MLSRDPGWPELALCIINNLNIYIHTNTNTHTLLLLFNVKKTEISILLSASLRMRSTIYAKGRTDNSPTTCPIFFPPVGQFLGRKRQAGVLCSLRQLCPTRSAVAGHISTMASPTPRQMGLPQPYPEQTEPCIARNKPPAF